MEKQGKSEGFDSCDQPSNCTQIGFKLSILQPMWPWNFMDDSEKIAGHLFYTTPSFVHHFKSISAFKLELPSGNTQFRSKLMIFFTHVTLLCDGWPWKTTGHLYHATSSFVHHFVAIGEFKMELESRKAKFVYKYTIFQPCDLAIWLMT